MPDDRTRDEVRLVAITRADLEAIAAHEGFCMPPACPYCRLAAAFDAGITEKDKQRLSEWWRAALRHYGEDPEDRALYEKLRAAFPTEKESP